MKSRYFTTIWKGKSHEASKNKTKLSVIKILLFKESDVVYMLGVEGNFVL